MPWSQVSRHARGYGSQWDKLRKVILRRDNGLCQHCAKDGKTTKATDVDHIKPKAKGGTDEETNLQSLCRPCHDAKTAADEGRSKRIEIGADGWPVG